MLTDTGVPWLIQPDETNQPECSKAGDTSTCVATDPRTATDPAVIASRDRPANGSGDGGGGGGHLVLLSRPLGEHLKVKVVSCGNEHVLLLSRIGLVFSLGIGRLVQTNKLWDIISMNFSCMKMFKDVVQMRKLCS